MTNMIDRERLKERLIQLTRDLVLIASTDARPEERKKCFQLIRNHLEEVEGVSLAMYEKCGYESLVALPDGVARPDVIFCGHLDVVEHPEADCYRSDVLGGRIYGPGAGDMKGQLAILVELFRHLSRGYPGVSIGLVITSDEERGGESGVKYLAEEEGLEAEIAIIPDGGSLTDVTVEEKGILHARVVAEGKAAHAARPWYGDNPIERLIRGLNRVLGEFDKLQPPVVDPDDSSTHWFPTCSITMLDTPNDSANRIPENASAVMDIRFPPPFTVESLIERIENALGDGLRLERIIDALPTHLAPDERFLRLTEEISGSKVRLARASAGSDARFLCIRGMPVILSRPRVGNLHGRDEWIEIDSMLTYFEICRRYVLERQGFDEVAED